MWIPSIWTRWSLVLWLLSTSKLAAAIPLQPTFTSCLDTYTPTANGSARLNVTSIYADLVGPAETIQLGLNGAGHTVLRVDLFGNTGSILQGYDNTTNKLATLFTRTTVGSISVYTSASWVCNSIFPANLTEPYFPYNTTYCPLPSGPFGLNISIPLYKDYALTRLSTQIRIVDTSASANTLACYDVKFVPYSKNGWYYDLFLWLPVAIAIGIWAVSWGARFAAGWVVGSGVAEYETKEGQGVRKIEGNRREARARKWGTMIVSGLSGERLSVSGGLLRFVTPGLRDIMYHIQFVTILGMIAVSWPEFAYPIIARGAWADLVWNTTLVQPPSTKVPVTPMNTTIPSAFQTMITNPYYPLYLDTNSSNPLLDLHGARPGLPSFAMMVGLRPQDLFGTCLSLFLMLAAAVFFISLILWFIHGLVEYLGMDTKRQNKRLSYGSSPGESRASLGMSKEIFDPRSISADPSPNNAGLSKLRRSWWRFRPKGEAGAFHAAALYGNLLRLILIFHLPITTFSIYQLVIPSASIVSKVFAALAFAFISIIFPAGVLWKISKTPSGKLYDATRTLLALGPMYNVLVEDKQMFRVFPLMASLITGIVVGGVQVSGIAQSVVLVLVELAMLIIPAIWYPWGEGASMGATHTFLGIIRVISALLVLLLSPSLQMSDATDDWLAYAILLLQTIVFLFFLFMLLTKMIEGMIRLAGGVHFDESNHPLDGGLFAAIADLDCLNPLTGGKAAARKRRKRGSRQLQQNVSAVGSLTTQMMLDRHSEGVPRGPIDPSISPGHTPFLSPYSNFQSNSYFVGTGTPGNGHDGTTYPPLGPPPLDRHSSDFGHDDTGNGNSGGGRIMDAWRPHPISPPPGGGQSGYNPPGGYAPTIGSPEKDLYGYTPAGQKSPGILLDDNPYFIQYNQQQSPPHSPPPGQGGPVPGHSRQASSNATLLNSPPGPSSPTARFGAKPNNAGLLPTPLAIPKRRSLNDLKEGDKGDSPKSEYSPTSRTPTPVKPKKRGWFLRNPDNSGNVSTSESDDEPGPRRAVASKASKRGSTSANHGDKRTSQQQVKSPTVGHIRKASHLPPSPSSPLYIPNDGPSGRPEWMVEPLPFQPVPTSPIVDTSNRVGETAASNPSWFKVFGLTRKSHGQDISEAARDENKARKAALANESGALFAGVDAVSETKKSFRVNRKGPVPTPTPTVRSPTGNGRGPNIGGTSRTVTPPISMVPLRPGATPSGGNTPERSFKVKRMGQVVSPVNLLPEQVPKSTRTSPAMISNAKLPGGNDGYPSSSGSVSSVSPNPPVKALPSAGPGPGSSQNHSGGSSSNSLPKTAREAPAVVSPTARNTQAASGASTLPIAARFSRLSGSPETSSAENNGQSESTTAGKSFKVMRKNQYVPPSGNGHTDFGPTSNYQSSSTAVPTSSQTYIPFTAPPPTASTSSSQEQPGRSFRVNRPRSYQPSPLPGGASSPVEQPLTPPTNTYPPQPSPSTPPRNDRSPRESRSQGYSPSAFVPITGNSPRQGSDTAGKRMSGQTGGNSRWSGSTIGGRYQSARNSSDLER